VSRRVSVWIGAGMVLAAMLAWAMVPRARMTQPVPDLESVIPKQFADWRVVDAGLLQMDLMPRLEDGDEPRLDQPYDQTLMRTYRNSRGDTVMLAVAYGREQRQELKIHRPELCYISQGFKVLSRRRVQLSFADGAIPAVRLITSNGRRLEPVTYWMRLGNSFATDAWQSRLRILKEGLLRRVPDGVLVRVSTAAPLMAESVSEDFRLQEAFLRDFRASVEANSDLFTGTLESLLPESRSFPLLKNL